MHPLCAQVKMYLDEKDHRQRVQQAITAAYRGALDRQVQEHAGIAAQDEEARALERRVADEEVGLCAMACLRQPWT